VSIYLSSQYESKIKAIKSQEDLTEDNFRKLFEYNKREKESKAERKKQKDKNKVKDTFWSKEFYSELDIKEY